MLHMLPDDADLAYRLMEIRQHIDELEVAFSNLAAEFKASKHWENQGMNSAVDWIRFNCHMTSNAAADRIAVGEHADQLEESRIALEAGDIGFAHVAVMARTANAVGDAFNERRLLEFARESSPGKFHYQCLHYRHAIDADSYAAEESSQAESRVLHMSTAEDGSLYLTGFLDSAGGGIVRNALESLAQKAGRDDHRLRPQRLADALVDLAAGSKRPTLQVTTSLETLLGLAGAPGAEMEFSLPISSAMAQRFACDCNVARVLLDQDSLVIDVGRSTPKIHPTLRKALKLRDRHCRWPGCEREAMHCDGHHLWHWIEEGPTDLDNLVLLCRRHHRLVHEGGWQLVKAEGGEVVAIAPTMRFAQPRGPD